MGNTLLQEIHQACMQQQEIILIWKESVQNKVKIEDKSCFTETQTRELSLRISHIHSLNMQRSDYSRMLFQLLVYWNYEWGQ